MIPPEKLEELLRQLKFARKFKLKLCLGARFLDNFDFAIYNTVRRHFTARTSGGQMLNGRGAAGMKRLVFIRGKKWDELAEIAGYDANKLSSLCRISARQLQRHFRVMFKCSPQRWLNDRRLALAKDLLLSGESVKKVALELGFKHPSHFCRHFKSRISMTPSEYLVSQLEALSLTVNERR